MNNLTKKCTKLRIPKIQAKEPGQNDEVCHFWFFDFFKKKRQCFCVFQCVGQAADNQEKPTETLASTGNEAKEQSDITIAMTHDFQEVPSSTSPPDDRPTIVNPEQLTFVKWINRYVCVCENVKQRKQHPIIRNTRYYFIADIWPMTKSWDSHAIPSIRKPTICLNAAAMDVCSGSEFNSSIYLI